MKRNDFINQVEDLGHMVVDSKNCLRIQDKNGKLIARVDDEHQFVLDTTFGTKPSDKLTEGFLDIMVEYIKTPIDEREDSKLYHLVLTEKEIRNINPKLMNWAKEIEF